MADQLRTEKVIPANGVLPYMSGTISCGRYKRLISLLVLLLQVNLYTIHAAIDTFHKGDAINGIQPSDLIKGDLGLISMPESIVSPNITVRFANPKYDCVTNEYCLDVEFQSDLPDQELFGMNVRFFYEESILELIDFRDFQGGYGPIAPDPPIVLTNNSSFGYDYFRFGIPGSSATDFVNGAFQLINDNLPPIYISTTGWTKLFQICFEIDDPNPDSLHFCPPIVWDLEQNPDNGGYLLGDDGPVMTIISEESGGTEPVYEHVSQFNWMYTGNGNAPPYGEPVETNCTALIIDASINSTTEAGCYFENRIFQPVQPEISGALYHWDFGYGAVPGTAEGYGPISVYYDTAGTKTVTLVIYPYEGGEECGDSSSLTFLINACPSNVVGSVRSTLNVPISGVNLRLYADADTNGVADNATLIRNVFTNSVGDFAMATLTPGHYVIEQTQPAGWSSFDDGDTTPDNDVVENIDSLDNLIPVSLAPGEIDMINYFIETEIPGSITGFVFDDFNGNLVPDSNEGIPDVEVSLFTDVDEDGKADGIDPVATQLTVTDGSYAFANVTVGNYVLVETNPLGYGSVMDFDPSNDVDLVPNAVNTNDTLPVTVNNAESDMDNYFMDALDCSGVVSNLNDTGSGSLRAAIACAEAGDTIRFLAALEGLTININSEKIFIDKTIYIFSDCEPRIVIKSDIAGLFDIGAGVHVEFKLLNITSGYAGNVGAAFNNLGSLYLENVKVLRNPLLPPGEYLIRNGPLSELFLKGDCYLETD